MVRMMRQERVHGSAKPRKGRLDNQTSEDPFSFLRWCFGGFRGKSFHGRK